MSPPDKPGVLPRIAAILDVVEVGPVSAGDLAASIELSSSTTYRLCTEMVAYGLLSKDPDGRFRLGKRFVYTGLATLAMPVLHDLSERTGEATQVWQRQGNLRRCVASVEARHEIRTFMPTGTLLPLPRGSSGLILSGEWTAIPGSVERGWVATVSDRTSGFASVSAPVHTHGEVVAALCVGGPVSRLGSNPGERTGETVRLAARRLEAALQPR